MRWAGSSLQSDSVTLLTLMRSMMVCLLSFIHLLVTCPLAPTSV
jgi:hypothetical protein